MLARRGWGWVVNVGIVGQGLDPVEWGRVVKVGIVGQGWDPQGVGEGSKGGECWAGL